MRANAVLDMKSIIMIKVIVTCCEDELHADHHDFSSVMLNHT